MTAGKLIADVFVQFCRDVTKCGKDGRMCLPSGLKFAANVKLWYDTIAMTFSLNEACSTTINSTCLSNISKAASYSP